MKKQVNTAGKTQRLMWTLSGLLAGTVAVSTTLAANDEIPWSVAEVFIELNNTDNDLGIHALIDGEPWKRLVINSPQGQRLLKTQLNSALKEQGLTEFFFESAEPNFEDFSPEEFFERHPKGLYVVRGKSLEGENIIGSTLFTHKVPAPPVTMINDMADADTECDEDEPGYNPITVERPVTISWEPVTQTHPDLGGLPVQPLEIYNYQVVVEIEGDDLDSVVSIILPSDQTQMTIPEDFMDLADGHVKYEVLARETSFNQTALESCFLVENDGE